MSVIPFTTKARVAANDANPWIEPPDDYRPPKRKLITDPVSGVQYMGFDFDEPQKARPGRFILAVVAWLILFALVL